ncbi:hypothetical protein G6O69_14160 [Pseudenhygromyxa sp. WMMC2535]|uniref:hypothetical protein n=1 Tax=Pseudenhygromyxa sp. WMMC2535 TaxID=2712867 RepID=UPI0015554F7B|nr:hypothetical protein [Pseudenhygromyxa sp. WMMC2535]NVB38982.1 hypothetical protein [Pseudenhygromyxa sp. WMMC2535]
MTRRTKPRRRVVVGSGGGTRRTIKAPSAAAADALALDDRPLSIQASADGRLLLVSLPWELWIVDARTLAVQRSVPLSAAAPSVVEGWEGALWIGGQHLYRGNLQATSVTKVGSKLGGLVDHVCLIRDDLLCGVGSGGEVLWDIDRLAPAHRRKSTGPAARAVVASADGRAVFSDGSATCWVIDPAHTAGYAQLQLAATSPTPVAGEAIVCLGRSEGERGGRVILAARDGAVAWTSTDLRLAGERVPARASEPLAVSADERWIYVLRGRGVVQRFLISQPPEVQRAQRDQGKKKRRGKGMSAPAPNPSASEAAPEPLPEAQEARLDKLAECLCLAPGQGEGERRLIFGGPKADGQLGRLWAVDVESLDWQPLALGERTLAEAPAPAEDSAPAAPERPSFVATRNKPAGSKIAELSVDDIVGARVAHWITQTSGSLLERATESAAELRAADKALLPADALLLPAMVRFCEGTARPALLLWPGVVEDHDGPPPPPQWLVWGDEPRGWMALETPQIRAQKWSRTDVFPLQVAIAALPEAPGRRVKIDPRWVDRAHFEALAKECKKLLKVLW